MMPSQNNGIGVTTSEMTNTNQNSTTELTRRLTAPSLNTSPELSQTQLLVQDLEALTSMHVEIDKLQQVSTGQDVFTLANSQDSNVMVEKVNTTTNQGLSLASNQLGNQTILTSAKPVQNTDVTKKHFELSGSSQEGQQLAKFILKPGTGSEPTQMIPIQTLTSSLSQSGLDNESNQLGNRTIQMLSPTKLVSGSPAKQFVTMGNRFPSPNKTPTKITMIPVSLGKSPTRIAPAPSGNMVAMVAKPGVGGNTYGASSKGQTITMSPSKVIIKSQTNLQQQQQQTQHVVAKQISQPQQVQLAGQNKQMSIAVTNPNVQQIQVPGSKFHYVRLVTAPNTQGSTTVSRPASIAPATQAKPIAPASQAGQMKITVPVSQMQQILRPAVGQRVLLPASSQIQIRPTTSMPVQTLPQIRPNIPGSTNAVAGLPPGATLISGGNNMQGFALVPAQYVNQLQNQISKSQAPKADSNFIPITSNETATSASARQNINGDPSGTRPRKPCNCTKSQCLKLYCDCFANGEFCHNCNCNNCANNLDHETERQKAVKQCLDRNPQAFHPKIGKDRDVGSRRHQKGCNCKRSGCLKNYCECYEAKILCSQHCKCVGCKNFEESPDRKTLMHLADAAEVRVQQQTAAKTKLSSQIDDLPVRPVAGGERLPYSFVTTENLQTKPNVSKLHLHLQK
ncbi:unnamed protein product [Owenia fusiformis]|uniref:CRC domain-containing protein n=1 Tax=Owenia fusiformis TaxID=6347 RepID=A0A8S4PLC7_OWEFU|nr:unnamed protein product [Owenia fusiformis]